jgi:potassium/chloride transporter 9
VGFAIARITLRMPIAGLNIDNTGASSASSTSRIGHEPTTEGMSSDVRVTADNSSWTDRILHLFSRDKPPENVDTGDSREEQRQDPYSAGTMGDDSLTVQMHNEAERKKHGAAIPRAGLGPRPIGGQEKLGMFSGVYVPTCLNVLSILMFLRFGFILGQGGIVGMMGLSLHINIESYTDHS